MSGYKKLFFIGLLCHTLVTLAGVPSEITLEGKIYQKVDENVMGNHKYSVYIQNGETQSNWTSRVAVHYFMDEKDPTQFAQTQFSDAAKIEMINGDKKNILQFFDTMNPVGKIGDPITFQQNVWRYQLLNYDKGIMSVEYSQRKMLPNQSSPAATQQIDKGIQDDIKSLPIERYSF
ncbi:hypothetical protein [Candidatus Berkiella aquae]|uniref:Uncharacterized protein n=1 Tax=Candidatus Berkiella aquae TaxID=295108 RepID=A0A0Q9YX61_9GAMM|nr:hypothetical protein [Candidatus Berkiella aquae]MCS5710683.1 hypothetical protein [Candidatus Berkiella aquae]